MFSPAELLMIGNVPELKPVLIVVADSTIPEMAGLGKELEEALARIAPTATACGVSLSDLVRVLQNFKEEDPVEALKMFVENERMLYEKGPDLTIEMPQRWKETNFKFHGGRGNFCKTTKKKRWN